MIKILELSGGTGATRAALRNLAIPVKPIDYVEIDEKPQEHLSKPERLAGL